MGSSGLGLTVTKRLIEAHHGTLSVESVKDKGTSFTITLPLPSEEAQSKTGPAEPLAQKAQKALGKVSTHTSLNEAEAPETPPQVRSTLSDSCKSSKCGNV